MKKHTAGLALAAVTGFSVLSATPAFAATVTPYPTCGAAEAEGVYNIPSTDPRFGPWLDGDGDMIGCDDPSKPMAEPLPVTPDPTSTPQMTQVPRGGVDAGVPTDTGGSDVGTLALAGGLLLVAASAGTYAVRRRNGNHA